MVFLVISFVHQISIKSAKPSKLVLLGVEKVVHASMANAFALESEDYKLTAKPKNKRDFLWNRAH